MEALRERAADGSMSASQFLQEAERILQAFPIEAMATDGVQVAQADGALGAMRSDGSAAGASPRAGGGPDQDAPHPILTAEERPPIPGGVDAVDPTTRSKPHPEGEWRPDESDPSGWRWTLIDPKTGAPVTANTGQPLTAHALELPPDALKPEDRAEARRLAEAWRVSRHIENAEHPAVLSVMRKMTQVQAMTPEEVGELRAEIKLLGGLGSEGRETAHRLGQKLTAALGPRPFDFPQALTTEQLASHLAASEGVEEAAQAIDAFTDIARDALFKNAPPGLEPYVEMLEETAQTHYDKRTRRLIEELARRRRNAAP